MVSNRVAASGHHARARAPGMARDRQALGIDALKTGFISMFKHS
jgi:hypothetical protein